MSESNEQQHASTRDILFSRGDAIRVSSSLVHRGYAAWVFMKGEGGDPDTVGRLGGPSVPVGSSGSMHVGPTMVLDEAAAQSLIDDLWNAGLRPTNSRDSAGVVDALSSQVEMMRTFLDRESSRVDRQLDQLCKVAELASTRSLHVGTPAAGLGGCS